MTKSHTVIDTVGPAHNHDRVLEADGSINVSQSKVKTWRQCRRQYHYKFVEMLKKRRIKRPFTFGTIVHNMIEAHAEGDDPFEVVDNLELTKGAHFRKEVEMYGNILEDIRVIMTEYFDYWENRPDDLDYIRRNKRSAEHEFRIELRPGLWFTGKIDGAAKAKRMRWVVEHKTFARTPSEDDRWRSVQGAVYFRAFEILGWPEFDGVVWDYVMSKPPGVPEKLKNGQMSQKKIVTLPTKLREFIAENGLKTKDYQTFLDNAAERRSEYFFRVFNPVKRNVVGILWDDFVETAEEIAELHGKRKSHNIGRHCTWCDYEGLCRAEMQNSDVEWLIEHDYYRTDEEDDGKREED